MIERAHIPYDSDLNGYDSLRPHDNTPQQPHVRSRTFAPNNAYDEYFKIHKVFVRNAGGETLQTIGERLEDEWLPRYLDVAGWSFAESALTQTSLSTLQRVTLMEKAEQSWQRALTSTNDLTIDNTSWLTDKVETFRLALNLAYAPLMQSIITGDVTEATRERVFADTLAIAQLSTVQLSLAAKKHDIDAIGEHLGFQYECNALLALLYLNNPNYVPLPSSARAGSGYDYRDQTHDINLIHQRWGTIHKTTPIEIKAAASLRDRQRYQALIVRGKMHLSVQGKYQPKDTLDAFAAVYEGSPSPDDLYIVDHVSSTMRDLIVLYQKGDEVDSLKKLHSATIYHDKTALTKKYIELSSVPRVS